MSLNSVQTQSGSHHFATPLINEMQREDFLALAAAVRQFTFHESDLSSMGDKTRYAESPE